MKNVISISARLPKGVDLLIVKPNGDRIEKAQGIFESLFSKIPKTMNYVLLRFVHDTNPQKGVYQMFIRRYGQPTGIARIFMKINHTVWPPIEIDVEKGKDHQELISQFMYDPDRKTFHHVAR